MDGQIERIAAFLRQYVDCSGGLLPAENAALEAAIKILLEHGIFSVSEMRFEALKEYDVIIPWDLFPKESQQ